MRRQYDEKRIMFQDQSYHYETSHSSDEYRYADVIEDQKTNSPPSWPMAEVGQRNYPQIGGDC